ncbi:MAG: N-acetyltransferase, partial [Chloroflexota bacterium]
MLLQVQKKLAIKDLGDRFVIDADGLRSYLLYRCDGLYLDLYCAYVPESLRGNHHAESMILFAFKFAVMNGYLIKPNCAAVRAFVKIYPEWRYIID